MKHLPAFSERYGLSPEQFWSLTQEEFNAYMNHARESAENG